jgi:UDP:flavonoid glycosyltransferase YjiC (YdhE family)
MKFLFITGGSSATVFAMAPLATALRNAGHDILLAANEPMMDTAEAIGIPSVSINPESILHFMITDRSGHPLDVPDDPRGVLLHTGGGFARLAAAGLDALLDLAKDWPPDVVVGGAMSYAAGLLATHLDIPFVRHAWDVVPATETDQGAERELRPEFERFGLTGLPEPDLFVDICPPSLRSSDTTAGTQPMRWIPGNRQRRLEPWMYTRPEGRRRVLITSGTRALMLQTPGAMRHLVGRLTSAGAEVLIAAPEQAAAEFGAALGDGVRIGWIPLDMVAPTCDLMVHHGGGVTAMTGMNAGVPQLIVPEGAYMAVVARTLADFGAGITLERQQQGSDQDAADAIAVACARMLTDPRYTRQAQALAGEIAALPTPADVVHTLEKLAAG